MGPGRNKHSQPRAVGGGRWPRYEERRKARGGVRRYAPEWSDAAAAALISRLHIESNGHVATYVGNWLTNPRLQDKTLTAARLSPADRELARRVIAFYVGRLSEEVGRGYAIVKAFLTSRSCSTPGALMLEPSAIHCGSSGDCSAVASGTLASSSAETVDVTDE